MATQVNPLQSANAAESSRVQAYVNRQLERTRKQVKLTDLFSGLMGLASLILGFLLVASVIDAWIWPFGIWARTVGLVLLILSGLVWTAIFVFPLLTRPINPQYAARMIEEAKPNFKNSLLNYLSLRVRSSTVHRAVYDAVSRQAAMDLSSVSIESTVDRSALIRLGLTLAAIATATIAYWILSPKSPWQTICRIVTPTARISAPAMVQISDIQPGDASVFFGDRLVITATVRGRHDAQDVQIVFSTDDGQYQNATIPMLVDGARGRYRAELTGGEGGIQQDMVYRIVARDGQSPDFRVLVRTNPAISIKNIRLQPPAYTRLPERTLEGQGEIEALEGTNVTLEAIANLPISVAYIELLNAGSGNDSQFTIGQTVQMQSNDRSATGKFTLAMDAARQNPQFSHYRIRFLSTEGHRNDDPNVYPIRVIPDLAPEVKITNPVEDYIRLPVNQSLDVQIEANDLDFEISSIDLHIDHQGTTLLDRALKLATVQGNQRATAQKTLEPQQLNLKPGDKAILFATAGDNRTSPFSGLPDPNISRTRNYTLEIIPPEDQPQPQTPAQLPNPENENSDKTENNQHQSQDGQESEPQQPKPDQEKPTDQQQSQEKQPSPDKSADNQSSSSEADQTQSSKNQSDSAQESSDSTAGSQGQPKGQESAAQESQSSQANDQGADNQGADSSAEQSGQGRQAAEPADGSSQESGSDTGQRSSQPGNQSAEQSAEAGASDSQGGQGQGTTQASEDDDSSIRDESLNDGTQQQADEYAHEGDQFERLQRLLEKQNGMKNDQGERQDRQTQPDQSQSSEDDDQPKAENSGQPSTQSNSQGGQPESQDNEPLDKGQNASTGEQDSQSGESQSSQEGTDNKGSETQGKSQRPDSSAGQQKTDQQPNDQGTGQTESGESESEQQAAPQGRQQDDQSTSQNGAGQSGKQPSQQPGDQAGKQAGKPSAQDGGNQDGQQSAEPSSEQQADGRQQGSESGGQGGAIPNTGEMSESANAAPPRQSDKKSDESPTDANDGSFDPAGRQGEGSFQPDTQLEEQQANLEHARQATDLVLDRLKDQVHNPDPELLKQMKWTEQDLRDFLERWEQMKRRAESGGATAKKEYENALKSLDLRPARMRGRQILKQRDKLEGLAEDSADNRPPADIASEFNAFLKERNRVKPANKNPR